MKTSTGTLNYLSYLTEMYVDLIFNVDLFFDSIQIELLPAFETPTQRWVFERVDNEYEDDERWELLHRIGRFLGRIWVFFAVWSPLRDTLSNLYSVTIVILFSSVVYNKYADEPVYSVTVIFQIDKEISCL